MATRDENPLCRSRSQEVSELDALMLFAADLRTAFLLPNEARYRTLERVFGAPRDQANIVTLIILGAFIQAAQDRADSIVHSSRRPTRTDGVLGGAVVEELLHDVGGPASRATPFLAALMLIGLLHGRSRPVILQSMTAIGKGWRKFHQSFQHHYRQHVEPTPVRRALTAARDAVGEAPVGRALTAARDAVGEAVGGT